MGSQTIKSGFAGEYSPKSFFSSACAYIPPTQSSPNSHSSQYLSDTSHLLFDSSLTTPTSPLKEIQPTIHNGLIMDFDYLEAIIDQIYKTQLHCDPTQHPLLISEPVYNTHPRRVKTLETVFEGLAVPQFRAEHDVVLDLFSVGKPSGLVLNSGSGHTTIAAVSDGRALLTSAKYSKVGGDSLDALLWRLLQQSYNMKELPLSYQYVTQITSSNISPSRPSSIPSVGDTVRSVTPSHKEVSASFKNFAQRQLLQSLKHECLNIPLTPLNPIAVKELHSLHVLPDGQVIDVGEIGSVLGESLFLSTLSLGQEVAVDLLPSFRHLSLPQTLVDCLLDTDVDLRTLLLNNIVLSGCNSLYRGLPQRLHLEVANLLPSGFRINISSQLSQHERRYATWIGGSVLASLSSFASSWIFKNEYEEFGAESILARKSA